MRGDHCDGAPPLKTARQLRVHPDDDHRRDREDRHRLTRDDIRQKAALQQARVRQAMPSPKPITAPSANPASASFAVKRALWNRIVIRAGWFTCAGWPNAFAIVQMSSSTCRRLRTATSSRPTTRPNGTAPRIRAAPRPARARRATVPRRGERKLLPQRRSYHALGSFT